MKLHIFGASGSGVTTTGNAVASQLGLPYFDSDEYYWEKSDPPFTVKRDIAERNRYLRTDLQKQNSWVLGGSVINWGTDVFPAFDLVVFLWLPPGIRMARLKERELQRYGEIIFTDPLRKQLYEAFMNWAADYDHATGISNRTIVAHERWLNQQTAPILDLRGDMPLEQRVQYILEKISHLPAYGNTWV